MLNTYVEKEKENANKTSIKYGNQQSRRANQQYV